MFYETEEIKKAIEIYKKKWSNVGLSSDKIVIKEYLKILSETNNTLTAKNLTTNFIDKLVEKSRNTTEYQKIYGSKYLVVRPGNTRQVETDIYFRNRLLSQQLLPANAAINYILDNNKASYEKRIKAINEIFSTNEKAMQLQVSGEEMTLKEKLKQFFQIVGNETYAIAKSIGKGAKTAGSAVSFVLNNLPIILIIGSVIWLGKNKK